MKSGEKVGRLKPPQPPRFRRPCNAMVNAKRRLQYKLNPVRKLLINQMYYNSQRDIRSQKVLHAYHANPLNAMRQMLDAYHSNPSTIKERARKRSKDAYTTNPSPIKEKARQRARDAYKTNPSPKRQRAKDAYKLNPSPIKRRAMHSYMVNPSPVKRRASEVYYKEHDANKRKRRQLYKKNRVLDKRRISKLVACSVLNKYSKICIDVPATTAGYIYRLTKQIKGKSYVNKHTTAQYLADSDPADARDFIQHIDDCNTRWKLAGPQQSMPC